MPPNHPLKRAARPGDGPLTSREADTGAAGELPEGPVGRWAPALTPRVAGQSLVSSLKVPRAGMFRVRTSSQVTKPVTAGHG